MSKTHVIDGVTYVEVERKADLGEKVIIINDEVLPQHNGSIGVVEYEYDGPISVNIGESIEYFPYVDFGGYRVLAKVKPEINDLIANLVRRVNSLEQQLAATQRNIETWAERTETVIYTLESSKPKEIEVVTFEKFIESIADSVAERLVGR
jgi:hypothetical protein